MKLKTLLTAALLATTLTSASITATAEDTVIDDKKVTIVWNAPTKTVDGETLTTKEIKKYTVYLKGENGFTKQYTTPGNVTSTVIEGLKPDVKYSVYITATADLESDPSNTAGFSLISKPTEPPVLSKPAAIIEFRVKLTNAEGSTVEIRYLPTDK